ncbi:hypothetical protein EF405_08280 [Cyclobacteriaceae bacterium YHN15]|nr:hypothetical protein EF405_08280 [Cyclobacteriaceae bacterium YHN15]
MKILSSIILAILFLSVSCISEPEEDSLDPDQIRLKEMGKIEKVLLDFSTETRDQFAMVGNGYKNFTVKIFGPKGQIFGSEDLILKNLELIIDGDKFFTLDSIPITKTGELEVQAFVFDVPSNVLKIISREDIVLPIREMQVVFHVFSDGPKLTPDQMEDQIAKTNLAFGNGVRSSFKRNINSVNNFLRFRLAENDPEGNPLEITGYNVIEIPKDYSAEDDFYEYYYLKFEEMWDPNRYINVFVENINGGKTSGYAYLPEMPDNTLPGLVVNESQIFNFPYAVTIDYNIVIVNGKPSPYTLAHELGHFLGLLHTFENCQSGDFCDDTLPHIVVQTLSSYRNTCNDESFISTNFMDNLGENDHFTYDQRVRMQTVYNKALFFPREENITSGRIKPFIKGQLSAYKKPIICNF